MDLSQASKAKVENVNSNNHDGFALDGKFMDLFSTLDAFTEDVITQVPKGRKENKYFVVDNTENRVRN